MYNKKIDYILELYNNKSYKECKAECEELMKTTLNNSELLWWIYFRMCLIYKKLGMYKMSIKFLKKAIPHTTTYKHRSIQNNWMLGTLYEKTNKDIAIKYYDIAIQECCEVSCKIFLINIVGNKAVLTNDITLIEQTLCLLDEITEEECNQYYYTKETLKNTIYENFAKIYINLKEYNNAINSINKIKNNNELQAELNIKIP